MTTKILAIDPSLRSTGISNGERTERWVPPKELRGLPRLSWFRNKITEEIQNNDYTLICIEGYAMGAKGMVYTIGELGGVLKLTAWLLGLDIMVVPPTTLKKFVTGKGNANKEQVLKAVHKRWDFLTFYNDEADAYALYQMGIALQSRKFKRTKEGQEFAGKCEYILADS